MEIFRFVQKKKKKKKKNKNKRERNLAPFADYN